MKMTEHKHFKGKYPRPHFDVYETDSALSFVSYWGENCEDLILPQIENMFSEVNETDTDVTLMFTPKDDLSFKANIIESILEKINLQIYTEKNQEQISSLVEILIIYKNKDHIITSQSGGLNLFLIENKSIIPVSQKPNLSDLQQKLSTPFPSQFLGAYKTASIETQIIHPHNKNQLLLSSLNLSSNFSFNPSSFSGIFNTITQNAKGKAFWSSLIQFA